MSTLDAHLPSQELTGLSTLVSVCAAQQGPRFVPLEVIFESTGSPVAIREVASLAIWAWAKDRPPSNRALAIISSTQPPTNTTPISHKDGSSGLKRNTPIRLESWLLALSNEKPPILLLVGNCSRSALWHLQVGGFHERAPILEPRHRAHRPADQRGCGPAEFRASFGAAQSSSLLFAAFCQGMLGLNDFLPTSGFATNSLEVKLSAGERKATENRLSGGFPAQVSRSQSFSWPFVGFPNWAHTTGTAVCRGGNGNPGNQATRVRHIFPPRGFLRAGRGAGLGAGSWGLVPKKAKQSTRSSARTWGPSTLRIGDPIWKTNKWPSANRCPRCVGASPKIPKTRRKFDTTFQSD